MANLNGGVLDGVRRIAAKFRDITIDGGVTGAALGYRLRGATASGAPASGTWKAGDQVPDRTGKIWICTTAGSPGTWVQVAADPPSWFRPETYGGKGDGIILTDATMATGGSSTHLACTTSNPFTPGDAGKIILVQGAGAAGADLVTTIASYTDSGHVILTAGCSTSVTGVGAIFGTDNTAAIKSARSARLAYAQASSGSTATVAYQPGRIYCVGGAATVGSPSGTGGGNAIFLDPPLLGTTPKLTLIDYAPGADAAALPHWLQKTPQVAGATIAVLRLDGTNDGTYGPAAVFGGPFDGYGGNESGTGLFTNICPVVDGITVLLPQQSTFSGWDFWGYAEAYVKSASAMTMNTPGAGNPWAQFPALSGGVQYTWGLRMPSAGNNARCDVDYFSCEGLCYGFGPSEHTSAKSIRAINTIIGIEGYSGNGVNMVHSARIAFATVEGVTQAVGGFDGVVRLDIDTLDTESVGQHVIYDPSGHLNGSAGLRGYSSPGYGSGVYDNGTGLGMKVIQLDMPAGPVASPQAPPATTVGWQNYYYRDAWITVSLSGGNTFTSLSLGDGSNVLTPSYIAQPNAAGVSTYSFMLPSAHAYKPVYAAGVLTHTVTLL